MRRQQATLDNLKASCVIPVTNESPSNQGEAHGAQEARYSPRGLIRREASVEIPSAALLFRALESLLLQSLLVEFRRSLALHVSNFLPDVQGEDPARRQVSAARLLAPVPPAPHFVESG